MYIANEWIENHVTVDGVNDNNQQARDCYRFAITKLTSLAILI